MQLHTLGGLKLEGAAFSQHKPLLLVYLALEGPQERRHLAELFWPNSAYALRNLRTSLTRLRAAGGGIIESDGLRVWTEVACDARELLTTLETSALESGIEAYGGRFLDGYPPRELGTELEEWVYQTREFLAGRVREGLLSHAETSASQGNYPQALEHAERAHLLPGALPLESDHLERLHALYVAGGSYRAEEVRKEALEAGLSLMVSPAEARNHLRSLHQQEERSNLRSLPSRGTSFVGRELELSEVTELLVHPECRLLSLVGVGGVGKTRLALEVAQEQLNVGGFVDGVVFVPLEALTAAASTPAVVADALGLSLSGQEDTRSVVLRFLTERQLLLVLDNFEQLLEGTPFIRELLDRCPRLTLLITSRERLNLEHEWVSTIKGMTFPKESTALEPAGYFDAVQLFVRRARRAQPGFALTSETLPAIARICRAVDGMPLALELAASWLRALGAGDIAGELETGMDLLEGLTRDVPERHRGVRVVFDHSWALLGQREQEVLRRLSVFRGGFRREAASVVAGATLPLLARLVDKSLLSMSPEGRYDRHPLLSYYTSEKLAEHPEEQGEIEEKHGRYFLRIVRDLEAALWTLERKEALRVFLEELANIRAAWAWATSNLRVEEIERTTPAMFDFFEFRLTEGLEYFGTTFEFFGSIAERLDESDPSHVGALGTALIHQVLNPFPLHSGSHYLRMRSVAKRGIELLQSLGEPRGLARGFVTLAESFLTADETDQAKEYALQALAVARKHGSASDIARALSLLSGVHSGTLAQYWRFLEEALVELRALNHLPGVAQFLMKSGFTLESEQRFEEAKARYWEAYRLADELGHFQLATHSLGSLSDASLRLGEFDQAATHAREGYRQAEETGLGLLMTWTLGRLGRATMAQGDFQRAREQLLRSIKMAWSLEEPGRSWGTASLVFFAELLVAEGSPGDAVALLAQCEGHWGPKDEILAELEGSMAPEEFAAAVERGQGRTLDEFVDDLIAPFSGSYAVGGSE